MSKTAKIKSDLDDMTSMVEVFQILKDVASNHFYNTAKRKERFVEFAESFVDFFRMISLSEAKSLLVHPTSKNTAILAVTSEGGFMSEMTSKVIRQVLAESEKYNSVTHYIIGQKGVDKFRNIGIKQSRNFVEVEEKGLYKTAIEVKDAIIEDVEAGKIGTVIGVYPRAMSLNFIKPYVIKLLPSAELLSKQEDVKNIVEKVIVESDLNDIMHYLASIWLICRIYEMLEDCVIAGFAAQSQQLESSLEKLKKDKAGLFSAFKKSGKSDIDKSLREVFTAKVLVGGR